MVNIHLPLHPVPDLIVRHCVNLVKVGVHVLLVSRTVGGCPSPNFYVAKRYHFSPTPSSSSAALQEVAFSRYGRAAAPHILEVWKAFSVAWPRQHPAPADYGPQENYDALPL